ncbi:hypothetical protein RF11_06293 [Thelohanellus kitauei]|uniref:Integrase catalytic domain-containing protein n=1 Tax=Thelohanellus kitauei TaxID=669202 RepID=A0A0C2N2I0_THEKT|nr:hypothetical protein RF11_06293 [Thelohanellus kitauei]
MAVTYPLTLSAQIHEESISQVITALKDDRTQHDPELTSETRELRRTTNHFTKNQAIPHKVDTNMMHSYEYTMDNRITVHFVKNKFTKWAEVNSFPVQTAKYATDEFIKLVIARFGLESDLFGNLCEYISCKKTRETPNHPKCNATFDRCVQKLKTKVKIVRNVDLKNLDIHLDHAHVY